jgi:hypothetical protein
MNWTEFMTGQAGWGAAAALVAEFLRRLLKGDIVLRREYESVITKADTATEKAEAAVERQAKLSEQTIAAQAELIKQHRQEDATR